MENYRALIVKLTAKITNIFRAILTRAHYFVPGIAVPSARKPNLKMIRINLEGLFNELKVSVGLTTLLKTSFLLV